jgi:hypothetical protein
LIVLAVAASGTYSYRQQAELARGRGEWEAEVARVRESGDPLTGAELEAFYKIPQGEDDLTALYVRALASCKIDFDATRDLPVVGTGSDEIPLPPEEWPQLEQAEAYLAHFRAPLDNLCAASEQQGSVRYPINLRDPTSMQHQHVMQIRDAHRLLELRWPCQVHRGDYIGATNTLIAMQRLPNTLRREPSDTAQLVRAALVGVAQAQMTHAISQPDFPSEELKRLQDGLHENDWQQACFLSALSSRSITYDLMQRPFEERQAAASPQIQVPSSFVLATSRPGDAAGVLRIHSDYVDAVRGSLPTFAAAYQTAESSGNAWALNRFGPMNPQAFTWTTNNIALSYLGSNTPRPFLRAAANERAAIAILAIERYRRERGKLPDTLDDLVPDYLAAVPEDPCNGYPCAWSSAMAVTPSMASVSIWSTTSGTWKTQMSTVRPTTDCSSRQSSVSKEMDQGRAKA